MSRRLPPLHLFYIFEASARLESFKLASEELFLSPSAVSHQVKALEVYLGIPLFNRKSRGVELNLAGKMYLRYVHDSLDLLEQGTKKVARKYASPEIKISTFPSLAANVIIPELGDFQNAHPNIEIRIETGMNITDLRYDDCDLALRIGDGNWPKLAVEKLFDIEIAALCTPVFANKYKLNSTEQLTDIPLIDLSNMENIWQSWTKTLGVEQRSFDHKLTFSNYESSLQAAVQGLGLVLAMLPIENSLLNRKVLVNPFNISLPFQRSLYAVYREEDKTRHEIQCFINWFKQSKNL